MTNKKAGRDFYQLSGNKVHLSVDNREQLSSVPTAPVPGQDAKSPAPLVTAKSISKPKKSYLIEIAVGVVVVVVGGFILYTLNWN